MSVDLKEAKARLIRVMPEWKEQIERDFSDPAFCADYAKEEASI